MTKIHENTKAKFEEIARTIIMDADMEKIDFPLVIGEMEP